VRTLLFVVVQALTVIAAYAFRQDDLALSNRAPLACLLAQLTRAALGPAFDLEYGQHRQKSERRAERAQKAAIEIPDENARY
jgi:hypothetical protein